MRTYKKAEYKYSFFNRVWVRVHFCKYPGASLQSQQYVPFWWCPVSGSPVYIILPQVHYEVWYQFLFRCSTYLEWLTCGGSSASFLVSFMHSFHRSRLSHDNYIWATLPGMRRGIGNGRQWPYMWPPVALMVVANIKSIWYVATTSTTKSPNLIVRIRSPQVTGGCRRSPAIAASWNLGSIRDQSD